MNKPSAATITCPRCGMTSHNPNDVREGYCGHCHAWTGAPCRFPPDAFDAPDAACPVCAFPAAEHPRP